LKIKPTSKREANKCCLEACLSFLKQSSTGDRYEFSRKDVLALIAFEEQ